MRLYYFIGRLLHPFAVVGFYIFSVFTKTPRVRVVVWNENDELLLVQTWLSGDTWGFPGGGVNRGESFEHAARRELREETDISTQEGELQQLVVLYSRGHKEIVFSLRAHSDDLPTNLPDKFEVKSAGWFTPEHTPRLDALAHEIIRIVAKKN